MAGAISRAPTSASAAGGARVLRSAASALAAACGALAPQPTAAAPACQPRRPVGVAAGMRHRDERDRVRELGGRLEVAQFGQRDEAARVQQIALQQRQIGIVAVLAVVQPHALADVAEQLLVQGRLAGGPRAAGCELGVLGGISRDRLECLRRRLHGVTHVGVGVRERREPRLELGCGRIDPARQQLAAPGAVGELIARRSLRVVLTGSEVKNGVSRPGTDWTVRRRPALAAASRRPSASAAVSCARRAYASASSAASVVSAAATASGLPDSVPA